MKKLSLVLIGLGVGTAITYLLFNQPSLQHETGAAIDDAAGRTFSWGTRQRLKGKGRSFAGRIKKGVGDITGNNALSREGELDQLAGKVQDGIGQLAHSTGETIHDLNR